MSLFPVIYHIDDVLPAIEGHPEFVVRQRDGYQSVDYVYAQSDSFGCPIRRECRGLKFSASGELIARPFHKFFNLHEKPDEAPASFAEAVALEKLDGSMIHPAQMNGELVFMTRAGITDQSRMAMDFVNSSECEYGSDLRGLCMDLLDDGWTPIFEFVSPHNQIVVKYEASAMVLLAIRATKSGTYREPFHVEDEATLAGIPCVRSYGGSLDDLNAFVTHAKALPDSEGYVVRIGQQFIKLKADDYVMRHRAKSNLLFEKDILRLVLEQKIDDVVGMLPAGEATKVQEWADVVRAEMARLARIVGLSVAGMASRTQKEFALWVQTMNDVPYLSPVLFSVRAGKTPLEAAYNIALKQTTSTAKARAFLHNSGIPEWKPLSFDAD